MTDEQEIKAGQTWLVKKRGKLKSTGQIHILEIKGGWVRIERFYTRAGMLNKKDWITPSGLRKRYRLLHEQETLT